MKLTYRVEPLAHQRQGIERAKPLDNFAFFFDPGCGKTFTAINVLRWKCGKAGRLLRTLVFAPQIVITNWREEFLKYSNFDDKMLRPLIGSQKERIAAFRAEATRANIWITNYESLIMDDLFKEFCFWKPEVIIFDESHKLKGCASKRTKRATKLAELATNRYLLTGTPVVNTIEDVFSQYRILDGGKTFGLKLADFREKYFIDQNKHMPRHCYFPKRVPRKGAEAEISAAMAPSSMKAIKSECLDLPPLTRKLIEVEMTSEQTRVYRELERDFVAELAQEKYVVTDMELTKGLRLQQIVTGFCRASDNDIFVFPENPRISVLEELLENLRGAQVIIWAVFRENYFPIRKLLSKMEISYSEITGSVGVLRRDGELARFNDGTNRVMLAHPKAAGIGANMTAAPYSIFYSRSYSAEDDTQAEARNYRHGSERHTNVTRYDLVTPGTIDAVIYDSIRHKKDVLDAVLKYLKGAHGRE